MNEKLLRNLYAINSPSGREVRMQNYLLKILAGIPEVNFWQDKKGNIYAEKRSSLVASEFPCIVAHMDEVHKRPNDCRYTSQRVGGVLFGFDMKADKFIGCGADDKNGIFVALSCLEKYSHIKAAFFVEEETGCNGSRDADMDFFKDCRFVLQADRRGSSDFIAEASFVDLCSDDFITAVNMSEFGYKKTTGLMTDVMELKENGLNVSACNLSCGYYNPHTENEYTNLAELENCLNFVFSIIENCTDVYVHEYFGHKKPIGNYWSYGYNKPTENYWGYEPKKSESYFDEVTAIRDYIVELYVQNDDILIEDLIEKIEDKFPLADYYTINSAYEEVFGTTIWDENSEAL